MNRTMIFAFSLLSASSAALVSSASSTALEVGEHAPCVELQDVQTNGTTVQQCIRTKEAGHSFVMLEFFSTTCSDCAANLPKLSQLAADIAATTTTRLVGLDRNETQTRTYIEAHRDMIRFPVSLDMKRDATQAYGVTATPTIYILDSDNVVIYKLVDVFSDEQLALVKSLVLR